MRPFAVILLAVILLAVILCGCPPPKKNRAERMQQRALPDSTSVAERLIIEELDLLSEGHWRRDDLLRLLADIEMAKHAQVTMTVERDD
jgi:hypothetical protein